MSIPEIKYSHQKHLKGEKGLILAYDIRSQFIAEESRADLEGITFLNLNN